MVILILILLFINFIIINNLLRHQEIINYLFMKLILDILIIKNFINYHKQLNKNYLDLLFIFIIIINKYNKYINYILIIKDLYLK